MVVASLCLIHNLSDLSPIQKIDHYELIPGQDEKKKKNMKKGADNEDEKKEEKEVTKKYHQNI
ncbi:hypothetical protein E2C01_024369 [Portunus trituberculatus]|uniref:Uncharacterized protein n=1 Tax=Portunus trituberculatus TaxID=210409 RepID=A0A5B7EAE6_PORTR|nr:hypothetical protein [Portunus trituberculatus]